MNQKINIKFNFLYFFSFCTFSGLLEKPIGSFFAILALISIMAYYIIQVVNQKNKETTIMIFFIYIYLFILLSPRFTSLINTIILIVLLLIYITEEILSFILYKKKYLIFTVYFYSAFLLYSIIILYFKEMLPMLNVFDKSSLVGPYENLILSLLLYLFLPFGLRYILLKKLALTERVV